MADKCTIPVIDLHNLPNQLPELISACENWGCFRLINHHKILSTKLMLEMKTVVRSLLDLPVEIKRRSSDVIAGSGYMSPSAKNRLYEALGLYDMAKSGDVERFCQELDATRDQREIIMRYAEAVHELCMRLVKKLAEGLGVKREDIGFENWPCEFRFNKYNFIPESVGSPGVQLHTDSAFLTILQDDESVGGLEVLDKTGKFITVNPWPDTLLVNLGDMAMVWSNGRFCNVKHRVQCKEAKIRVSIASFLLGPRGIVEPLSELVDDDHPLVYMPTTYEDYRKLREIIMRYAEAVHELCMRIMKKLAEGLGVKREDIGFENWPCEFRFNKYNFIPESVGSPGVRLHTDSAFLTILQDDESVGGLEVMDKTGKFITVNPWPDTLLVNLGDMATVWSNGRFCNVKHRVQCKEAKIRVSIASFLLGPRGIVEPLSKLVDDGHPLVYMPTTYEDYRKLRFSTKLQAGEALEHLYTPRFKK
ncbi:flavanone 3-hydroxylase [Artemisia annua]|uniref:2-oxoglutarate-dependent dioxygenase DAO n=1 Tax=Artemisia annua TaxID=35608 RepID=A0A2U1L429_ARTAN|nr:flavanone 3-hydroxylase [Artemisia annua]